MDKLDALSSFAALGQETRLDVLRLLIKAGEQGMSAGEIGDHLGIKQNTMSANLAVLARTNLVTNKREGRSIRYYANFAGIRELIGFLMEDCCGGTPEICNPLLEQLKCP
ncbi:MAG: helix-turn-helix transcriptional regulator [Rhizobiales bacterium]|nr:helix-turn-helix transcriptional regulator [Hyphomicrobiales bacterium]